MRFWQMQRRLRPLVVAHRGGALLGPENAAGTVAKALVAGADAVELDVRLTADRRLVCFHDADLKRLAGDERLVEALDYGTLKTLCAGVMTLGEGIAASAPGGLLLDVKVRHVDALAPILAELGSAKHRVMLGLRTISLIASARSLDPDLDILGFLADPDSAKAAHAAGANWFRLWQADATAERLAMVRAAGLLPAIMVGQPRSTPDPGWPSFPVGIIDEAGLSLVLGRGPDAILLDDPRLLRPAVPRHCHSSVV